MLTLPEPPGSSRCDRQLPKLHFFHSGGRTKAVGRVWELVFWSLGLHKLFRLLESASVTSSVIEEPRYMLRGEVC
jgi:hypothetical protein